MLNTKPSTSGRRDRPASGTGGDSFKGVGDAVPPEFIIFLHVVQAPVVAGADLIRLQGYLDHKKTPTPLGTP